MMRIILVFFCFICPFICFCQKLSGVVVNEQGERLQDAVIYVSDRKLATTTDKDGLFKITFPNPGIYTINVSYLGYETMKQTIDINGNENIRLVMVGSIYQLKEVEIVSNQNKLILFPANTLIKMQSLSNENLGQDMPTMLQNHVSMVSTSDAGMGIGYSSLRLRGVDASRINVTINDVPVNDGESQNVFWVDMPDIASSAESISIQRGVGPSTNGAGAYGGSIALNTFGIAVNPSASVSASIGSFNTHKIGLRLNSGLMNNRYNVEARYSIINSDGYIDRAASQLKSWYIEGAKVSSKSSTRLIVFSGEEETYQAWNGVPEARLNGELEKLKEHYENNVGSLYQNKMDSLNLFQSGRTYNYYRYENQIDHYEQTNSQFHHSRILGKKLSAKISLHYTKGRGYFEEYRFGDPLSNYKLTNVVIGGDTFNTANLIRRRWLDNDFYGALTKFEYKHSNRHIISVGGGMNQYNGDHFGHILTIEGVDVNKNYDDYYENKGMKSDFNTYVRWEGKWSDKIQASVDLQYRNVQYNIEGTENKLQNIVLDKSYNFINPKIAINYQLSKDGALLLSFGIANREPDRSDLVDNIKNEKVAHETLFDTELMYKLKKGKFLFESNLYLMNYKNQLVSTGALNDVGSMLRINVPHSYRMGLEINAAYSLTNKLAWNVNATLSRNKIKAFTEIIYDYANGVNEEEIIHENSDISFSPAVIFGNELKYNFSDQLSLSLISKFVGKQFLDNTSNDGRSLDAFLINNLRARFTPSFKFTKQCALILQVNNMLDRPYESNGYTFSYKNQRLITENFYFPQAGLHFMLGVEVKF